MFGLFSGKKADLQVARLASELEEIFASLFQGADVPSSFVMEPYVCGYIVGYSTAVMDIRFDALNWTKDRRGKFQIDLYRQIGFTKSCGFDRFLKDLDIARQLASNPDFCRGRDEASICAVVAHNKLKAGISDPLIDSAKVTAEKLQIDLKASLFIETIGSFKLNWR